MAHDGTLNIEAHADTSEAQRSFVALADSVDSLGRKIGGELGKDAQAAADKLRALGNQRDMLQLFLEIEGQVKSSGARFRELSNELANYRKQIDGSTDPLHVANLQTMQKAVDGARATWEQHSTALKKVTHWLSDVGVSAANARQAFTRINADFSQATIKALELERGLKQSTQGLNLLGKAGKPVGWVIREGLNFARESVKTLATSFDSLRQKFGSFVDVAIGKFSFSGLANAVQEMQDVRVALQAVTGDAESAGKQFDFVRKVANSAGTDIGESAQQWMKLSAAAKGTALEGKATQDVFAAVTNAMSNMGRSGGETGAVLQTLTQIINGEDVSARQLERTLGTQLPGALQAAAKGFGVTEAELRKMLDSGKITAENLLPALAKGLDETVNAAPAVAKVSDAFQRVKNAVSQLADEWGNSGVSAALVEGAEIASAAIYRLTDFVIRMGQIFGATFSAIINRDFSNYKQALMDIADESNERLAKMAQDNEYVRKTIEVVGSAAQQTALQAADLAAKEAEAGNAAAAAAPQLEALGMSYKALGDEVAKVKDTEALELEVIQGRIKAAEEDIKMEGLSAEAKLEAQKSLEEARQAELDFYTNRIKAQGELLAAAQEQLKAEQAAAAASKEEAEKRKPVIEQLKTLVNMREKDVQKTMEQIKAAQKNAEASSKEAKAAEDARKALEAKNRTRKMESDALIKSLEAQKESARIGEELARQMGNEYQVRQFKIQQLEIEVKITLAKADAAHAEAQGSIDVAKAQMDELRAKGVLTDAKKAELQASIKLGEARLKEAAAIRESAKLQEHYVQQVRYSATATNEATASATQGWNAVAAAADGARGAVDGYSNAVRNAPPPPSSGGGGGGGSDGGGSSGSSSGGGWRSSGKKYHTWKSLYEYALHAGADEKFARELADAQFSEQGRNTGALQQRYRRHKLDYFSDEVAVQRAIEQKMRFEKPLNVGKKDERNDGDGQGRARSARHEQQERQPPQPSQQAGRTITINMNGRRTSLNVGSDGDAHTLERLLREIANDQERAA